MDFESVRFTVASSSGVVIRHEMYAQTGGSKHLMALLPGIGYTVDHPLLYYMTLMGLKQGYDVLPLPYFFHTAQKDFDLTKMPVIYQDSESALKQALSRGYDHLLLVGKSLGTPVAAMLTQSLEVKMSTILLTPVQDAAELVEDTPTLTIIGTKDSRYDHLKTLETPPNVTWKVFDGLDHSLEVAGDVSASLAILPDILKECEAFIRTQKTQ